MRQVDIEPAFEILEPAQLSLPYLFNSPHSGDVYPPGFLAQSRLDLTSLRRSADLHVDRLFAGVVRAGAPLMRAHFPRTFVDLNREPYELDPRLFDGRLPSFANTRSLRVAGGLGTLARVVGDAQEIYARRLSLRDGLERIERYYHPYHATLRRRLSEIHAVFGEVILVDCHSMPSSSIGQDGRRIADIILGDRYGASCSPELIDLVEGAARRAGFTVQRNHPYAGGFITEHYGHVALGMQALQIEINRALYMDERTLEPLPGFEKTAAALDQITADAFAFSRTRLQFLQTAAE